MTRLPGRAAAASGLLLAALFMQGCGHKCVEDVNVDCQPLYTPNYDEVFTRTLQPSCALSGSGCHGSEGGQGGLVFVDADLAYDLLTDDEFPRVVPGDPGCSELVIRLESTRKKVVMPRGGQLSEAERCSVTQWIANGAQR